MIRVTPDMALQVEPFLRANAASVMFPLNNLVRYGLDGSDGYAPRMWRNEHGEITDILSITKDGMVMPFLPSGDYEAASKAIAGRTVIGVIGPAAAARGIQTSLGLRDIQTELDADEAHFSLSLKDMSVPHGDTRIVPSSEDTRDVLTGWLIDYHVSILGMTPQAAAKAVPDRITQEIRENRRVILMDGDTPLSTTAFNAALPDIVQVGGVYTPPQLRGQGHARRAVALHLAQAHADGVRTATLFANHPSAIAAYRAVGFKQIGDWVLCIFKTPQVAP